MTLYFLEWDNGMEYSDHDVEFIGIYTTPELRAAARQHIEPARKSRDWRKEGFIVETDVEVDRTY